MCELPEMGWLEVPGGIRHYWLGYVPGQKASEGAPETKHTSPQLLSALFLAVGTLLLDEWRCSDTLTAHFQFQTEFFEQHAAAMRTEPGRLQRLGHLDVKPDASVKLLCDCLD